MTIAGRNLMTELLLAGLTGGVIYFVWSAISWMALPWQRGIYKSFRDEEQVAQVLKVQATESGIYGLPAEPKYPAGASKEQRAAIDGTVWSRLRSGPTLTAVIGFGGMPTFPRLLVVAFAIYLLVAFLFAGMLSVTHGLSYWERVAFVGVLGLAAGIICRLPDWNWHQYPLNYASVQIASLFVGWLLSGLAIAYFINGR